jgi:hypothetical protein
VPTTALRALAGGDGVDEGFTSAETMIWANAALWRIGAFNQLVMQQTAFNTAAMYLASDKSLPPERMEAVAEAGFQVSKMLHKVGVGGANAPDGWYFLLKKHVTDDLKRLDRIERFLASYLAERRYVVGDVAAIAFVVAAAVMAAA